MNLEALLANEFVVLALDALLHVALVFVLSIVVLIACKLLSPARAFQSSNIQSIDKALMDLVVFEETGYYPT